MRRSSRAAFTLLEIVLTLAVFVVLAALTYPSLEGMYGQSRLIAGADGIKATLITARAQAVEEGVPYRVAILPGKGNFRLAPDLAANWNGTGSTSSGDGSQSIVVADHLPSGIIFSDTGSPQQPDSEASTFSEPDGVSAGEYKTVAVFLPDGTARDDYKVLVCSRNGSPLWVVLRSLTGEVSVLRYQTEGGQ